MQRRQVKRIILSLSLITLLSAELPLALKNPENIEFQALLSPHLFASFNVYAYVLSYLLTYGFSSRSSLRGKEQELTIFQDHATGAK